MGKGLRKLLSTQRRKNNKVEIFTYLGYNLSIIKY